jgi:hypothetical protein
VRESEGTGKLPDWVKIILPIVVTATMGWLLNGGITQNCETNNDLKSLMARILLTAPNNDNPDYQEFLDRTLPLLEPKECGVL